MATAPARGRRSKPPGRVRRLVIRIPRRAWIGVGVLFFLVTLATVGTLAYWWVRYSEPIDARLHGERDRVLPRVYARPLELCLPTRHFSAGIFNAGTHIMHISQGVLDIGTRIVKIRLCLHDLGAKTRLV